jgi:hypothetical protein
MTAMLLFAANVLAQQPDVRPYQTEEDLWEALNEDEISFEEFLDLLELHRLGADGTLVPSEDWEQLPGSDAGYLTSPDSAELITETVPPQTVHVAEGIPIRYSLRSGYDADLSGDADGEGYSIARLEYGQWRGLFDWEHDGADGRWRRRTLAWSDHGLSAQVGSIEPRWGRGLVVGRRSRFLGSTSSRALDGSVLWPTRSRFNGVWLASEETRIVSGSLLYSDIRNGDWVDRVVAAQVAGRHDMWRIGFNALSGVIDDRAGTNEFSRQVAGGHVQFGDNARAILAELAMTNDGRSARAAEMLWPLRQGRVHAQAWAYNAGFVNPWGGGPAHSDGESIILDGINESYTSRTSGERGFSIDTRVRPAMRWLVRWEWMTHKESRDGPLIHHWTVRVQHRISDVSLTPYARGKSIDREPDLYAVGAYSTIGKSDRRGDIRFEYGRHHVDADPFIRAGAGIRWRLHRQIVMSPSVRWVDPDLDTPGDAYWYLYFTETVLPVGLGRIEAALVWQRFESHLREDRVELRMRLVTGA